MVKESAGHRVKSLLAVGLQSEFNVLGISIDIKVDFFAHDINRYPLVYLKIQWNDCFNRSLDLISSFYSFVDIIYYTSLIIGFQLRCKMN